MLAGDPLGHVAAGLWPWQTAIPRRTGLGPVWDDSDMKPGERIRLITEAADSLSTRPSADINLVLDQFGFNTARIDDWDDERDYCVWSIKDGGDDEIVRLHEYLLGEDAAPTPQQTSDRPWGSHPVAVFLSHKWEDAAYVGQVKKILGDHYGIDAFVAHDDIEPSKKWREVIKAALASCHVLVAVMHDMFHESQWCDQEVGWALGRNVPVVTVRREGIKRGQDGFLEEHQDVTVSAKYGTGEWFVAGKIFEVVLADPRTHSVGVKALAEAFVSSFSYDQTRLLWDLIERESHWDGEQLRRFEYAVATNRQVYEAVRNPDGKAIPDLVKGLVERLEPPPPPDPWATSPSPGWNEPPF